MVPTKKKNVMAQMQVRLNHTILTSIVNQMQASYVVILMTIRVKKKLQ